MTEPRRLNETVYLAGSITGLTYEQSTVWRVNVANALVELGYDVFSPMREKLNLRERYSSVAIPHTDPSFKDPFQRDTHDIARSNYVVAYFHPAATIVSVGTMIELGYAKALGKYVIVVDERPSGEIHPFVRGVANDIVPTLDDAIKLLAEYRPILS